MDNSEEKRDSTERESPVGTPAESGEPAPAQEAEPSPVTHALLAANLFFWILSTFYVGRGYLMRAFIDGPDAGGLLLVGASHHKLIYDYEQWWRLISPTFLHSGVLHLAFNSYSLFLYGPMLERALGKGTFLGLYLLSGVGGFLLSSAMSPVAVSVGASAAVFGLIGAVWSLLKRRNAPESSKQTIVWIIGLNFIWGLQPGSNIDNWGHAGGLLTGLLLGLLLESLPHGRRFRAGLNLALGLVSLALLAYGLSNAIAFARNPPFGL
jgi:rhomboid protease GluP